MSGNFAGCLHSITRSPFASKGSRRRGQFATSQPTPLALLSDTHWGPHRKIRTRALRSRTTRFHLTAYVETQHPTAAFWSASQRPRRPDHHRRQQRRTAACRYALARRCWTRHWPEQRDPRSQRSRCNRGHLDRRHSRHRDRCGAPVKVASTALPASLAAMAA